MVKLCLIAKNTNLQSYMNAKKEKKRKGKKNTHFKLLWILNILNVVESKRKYRKTAITYWLVLFPESGQTFGKKKVKNLSHFIIGLRYQKILTSK